MPSLSTPEESQNCIAGHREESGVRTKSRLQNAIENENDDKTEGSGTLIDVVVTYEEKEGVELNEKNPMPKRSFGCNPSKYLISGSRFHNALLAPIELEQSSRGFKLFRKVWKPLVVLVHILSLIFTPLHFGWPETHYLSQMMPSMTDNINVAAVVNTQTFPNSTLVSTILYGTTSAFGIILALHILSDFLILLDIFLDSRMTTVDECGITITDSRQLLYLSLIKRGGLAIHRLLKSIILLVLIAHMDTCLFWAVTTSLPPQPPLRWADQQALLIDSETDAFVPFSTQYLEGFLTSLRALYLRTRRVATEEPWENAYAIGELVLGVLTSGTVVGMIHSVVELLDQNSAGNHAGIDESFVFQDLPKSLLQRIKNHLFRDLVKNVQLFADMDDDFLDLVALKMRSIEVLDNLQIFRKDDQADEMYIIKKGSVQILDGDGKILTTLGHGACFGEIALYQGIVTLAASRTINASKNADERQLQRPLVDLANLCSSRKTTFGPSSEQT
ncbi:hypothetical protein HDU97_006060 [Phlyctochytrium planicorne]|nr:hypothetical protein HDU97_006060 [Phlyctochytrium planicorne]